MLHVQLDIIGPDEKQSSQPKEKETHMKKLMTLMLGLSLVFGTVAVVFAQETTKTAEKTMKKKGKKKTTTKEETTKKEGTR